MPGQSLTALLPLASAILHTQTPPQSFHALPRDHLYRAFDGLIVDASPRGPLHDGDSSNERAMWLLDAFEASGKPVALAVDGVCDETIEHLPHEHTSESTRHRADSGYENIKRHTI